jgi:hypothetical protein
MPKINVYLPQWLADAVRESGAPVSEVCQRALSAAVGRSPMSQPPVMPLQPVEERIKDLERGAQALRYGIEPTDRVPALIKPIGAATALSLLKRADPSLVEWEHRAQDVAGHAAAVETARDLHAPKQVVELLEEHLAAARAALDDVKISDRFGPRDQVLDLMAELSERAHPNPPR